MQTEQALPVRDVQPRSTASRAAPLGAVTYRTDIDGLRALAVVPVVLYHVGVHVVRGGFIGVDVFFVISGFLITQLLYRDIRGGKFSIIRFYERRIRRIFPALVAVLLAVFVLGNLYCLPAELVDLSKSLTAAVLSVSNFYFWMTSGYFDGQSGSKPLLHTWSLAVEEQFYVFWPLLLFALHTFVKRRMMAMTVGLVLVSFLISLAGMWFFPSGNFYLPFSRAWELGIGALLALDAVPAALGPAARNLMAGLGFALIAASVFLITGSMPFPGLLALPPCLGAGLIILAGRDGSSLVGRLLSLRPVVFVGLVSYSLYLWHWPIFVFQKNYGMLFYGLSESTTKIVLVTEALLVASLSWKLIEQPFRTGALRPSDRRLLQLAAVAATVCLALGLAAWSVGGFPGRYSPRELQVASYLQYNDSHDFGRIGRCFLIRAPGERSDFAPECLALSKDRKNYLLLGDSHAAELWSGFSAAFPDINFLETAASDCFPTVVHALSEATGCDRLVDGVFKDFLTHAHVDQVLLAARWKPDLLDNLAATVAWLKERKIPVTLFGPTVVYDSPFPRLMLTAMRSGDSTLMQRHIEGSIRELDAAVSQVAASAGVPYISLINLQCTISSCAISPSELPLIFDQEHFTTEGATILAHRLRDTGVRW
jgi:peptidoglycan/LPS O-acetylase OafA/YrhL